ncbi:hypothetical protein [Treponema saccharophilum]|nr:hypothetical protein [Treponema saccharophilum]
MILLALLAPLFAEDFEIKEKISAGTVLVMNRGPCTEERFVFTSESAGIYQEFSLEFCKESEENTFGIMYEKAGDDKAFYYDGKTGRVKVDGDEMCGVLVYIPEKKAWFMYDDSVVFVRAVLKARKLASAWGTSRFSKAKFIFFSDGKCRIYDIDGTYTESNGIFCVANLYSQNFQYFFQTANALYQGYGYLSEQTEEK